jgi:hypothetical protein
VTTWLRRFTEDGLARVHARLDEIQVGERLDAADLLDDDEITEAMGERIEVRFSPAGSRRDAAEQLHPMIEWAKTQDHEIERDRGLWTWLAVFAMDDLAPVVDGRRKLGERARWVLDAENWQRYYRHLLAGPYSIYSLYSENPNVAQALLANPVRTPGDVVEQIASRQDLVRAAGVMEATSRLYVGANGELKRGAAGKDSPGSARRLAEVLQQLDLTYDLQSLDAERVLQLLPQEFDRFS